MASTIVSLAYARAESSSITAPNKTVTLRGYGEVSAVFSDGRADFFCEDGTKADMVLGKLLADLFWDAGESHVEKKIKIGGAEIILHQWQPYGVMVAAVVDRRVVFIGAETEESLLRLVEKEPLILKNEARFHPLKPYPLYLDFFDLRAFKAYTHAMSSPRGDGLASHWKFIRKFGMGGIAFQNPCLWMNSPAPGVVEWAPVDYEMNEARRQGGLIVCCPYIGGEVPLWMYNQAPSDMTAASPTSLIGAWGCAGCAGAHYESWGMPFEKRQSTSLAFLRQIMDRYKDNPSLGAWQPYTGEPGGEYGLHDRTSECWDYSPRGQECMRQWLKDVKGLSLMKLGERWHGDPGFYKSWREVCVPDVHSFFGDLDKRCLRLSDGWRWRKAADDLTPPSASAPGWVPVEMPPSQQQDFLPWGAAFYRISFDGGEWTRANAGKEWYLVCAADIRSPKGTSVWLNGKYFGEHNCKAGDGALGPFGLKVTSLIKETGNELVLLVPSGNSPNSEGKLYGPVFLSTSEPKFYPYLGIHQNARYVDLKEWQVFGISRLHRQMLETVRAIDPERPLILSPGSCVEIMDQAADMAVTFGAGMQMTGREAWYHPWWTGLGHVAGFYGTSEPGDTARGKSLSRLLGWIMMDADSNHDLFWTLEDYIKEEKDNGWFSKNQAVFRLFGKYLRADPKIVILRSVVSMRLNSQAPWVWDVGRGELQGLHFDNVYTTERELLKGLVDPYPALIDSGTEFMDVDTVAALRSYVEKGGTFVALHNTGRHSTLEPDTWPVSQLTGFKVVAQGKRGKITFRSTSEPLFKEWAGKEFEGEGMAMDYMGADSAKGAGIGLEANASGATVLATWDDGTVAVGCRKLGKGRVIVLGSTFWRNGKDVSGAWKSQGAVEAAFFERLLADIGVARDADAGSSSVWARKYVSKNGLQDWLIAYNSADAALKTDLFLKTAQPPSEVFDLVERKSVPFEISPDGLIKLRDISFSGHAVRAFAVKRAGFAGALSVWWGEKLKYWKKNKINEVDLDAIGFPKNNPDAVAFEKWSFITDPDGKMTTSGQWMTPGFDDSAWTKLPAGPWNLIDEKLKDYRDVGLYRAKFIVPREWKGRRIILNLYGFNNPIVQDEGEFFVNGKSITTYKAHGWNQTYNYDATEMIVDGDNALTVKVKGGKELSGICGTVWFSAERKLEPLIDLAGSWRAVKADFVTTETASIPGKFTGSHLRRIIDIPAEWNGKSVFLHFESPSQWVGSVVVNGHPVNYNSYLHPFGLRTEVNITQFMKYGTSNLIELWPYQTISSTGGTGGGGGEKERTEAISAIGVGCERQK